MVCPAGGLSELVDRTPKGKKGERKGRSPLLEEETLSSFAYSGRREKRRKLIKKKKM